MKNGEIVGYNPVPIYGWKNFSWSYSNSCVTYKYELHRELAGEISQTLFTSQNGKDIEGGAKRVYKTYSIVITSEWTEENPAIRIYKECETYHEALYGAKFDVTLEISGLDIYENEINKTITLSKITDNNGVAEISTRDISKNGVYIGTFTGTIEVTFKETAAPAGHLITQETSYMTIKLEKGLIKEILSSSKNKIEKIDAENAAKITIYNNEDKKPVVQITKVDKNNNLVKEAYFEIHVSYTDSNGKLIDQKSNLVRGQTKNGVLYLTQNDFLKMNNGFNIQNYTGRVTLNIVEVKVDGAYSLASNSKDITLEYKNGILINYTQYTDAKVTTEYLYDSVKDNVYKYITGQIKYEDLNAYVRDFLDNWVKKQEKNTGMTYNDVLAWLKSYIEQNKNSVMEAVTTLTTEILANVVQITVEDEIGNLPDLTRIYIPPKPDPLFMTIGGTVFLDEHTTKAAANESNGLLDVCEELLLGIEVTLYNKNGSIATLTQKYGEIRTNPTITDADGYYEFRGVDPFGEYYVVFSYNGMEYTNTLSNKETYNTEAWSLSSKGTELTGNSNTPKTRAYVNTKYSEITPNTYAYDYYTIQSLYVEIATRVQAYINTYNSYPNMENIYAQVIQNHQNDAEISKKIEYIKTVVINAYAGYSSRNNSYDVLSETYPYYSISAELSRLMTNYSLMNMTKDEYTFAGENVIAKLYPGQMQINLGLVQRDRTDLSLLTDIVDTRVSINGYDGIYEYNEDSSSYNQYIYEEDYNYKGNKNNPGNLDGDGVAYYTDDNMEFFMTYEIEVTNETLTKTAVTEIVDYYDENFVFANSYTTSKGIQLNGYKVFLNGNDITGKVQISNESRYGFTEINTKNTNSTGYKKLFIRFNEDLMFKASDKLNVNLTFKMNEASATLYNKIYTQKTSDYSKLWTIGNYAEINGYKTQDGFLDADSRPGNFDIAKYEVAKSNFQNAYSNYVQNRTEENARKLKLEKDKLLQVREDDAWNVLLTLTNSGYSREINGNVWEAISDEIKSASQLQENTKLLEYVQGNGLKGIKVELVELCDGNTEIIRAKTETDNNGGYSFKAYIPGDYVVRFIYGEQGKHVTGKTTNMGGESLEVNGQYYQSTKANNKTNDNKYWYNIEQKKRYSDAYDDANSRIKQINSVINGTNSTSSNYEYDGVMKVQSFEHKDTMYAYTSTLNVEVEYANPAPKGNMENKSYEYKINNIDFGLTPRANADLNVKQYVSNIKVYLQDGKLQLNANVDENGKVTYIINENNPIYSNIVLTYNSTQTYLDGLIEALLDEELLNGATLELTYKFIVSNDGEYDTIKYIKNSQGTVIAVAYYDEKYNEIPLYEGDRAEGIILNHNEDTNKYSLEKYVGEEINKVKTRAINIVDYIEPSLNYIEVNKAGEKVNTNWEITNVGTFNSSCKNANIMNKYNTIIRAKNNSPLYTELLPTKKGEKAVEETNYVTCELVLSKILETSSTGTNDWEYENLAEITRITNNAGKVTELKGYDITGKLAAETAEPKKTIEIKDNIYATLGTAKSGTLVIHAPTGLNIVEEAGSNILLILVALIILALGIILIKKFVIKQQSE